MSPRAAFELPHRSYRVTSHCAADDSPRETVGLRSPSTWHCLVRMLWYFEVIKDHPSDDGFLSEIH
jgi:hypothetical protein